VRLQDLTNLIVPEREIEGLAAVLLPFDSSGINYSAFEKILNDVVSAGLKPAVNMDTGFVERLSEVQWYEVLKFTHSFLRGKEFVSGVVSKNHDLRRDYMRGCAKVQELGGVPILFPCKQMRYMGKHKLLKFYADIARAAGKILLFELGTQFSPNGLIMELDLIEMLMHIPEIQGLKHSSLDRELEWQRLELRNRVRPSFKLYTGNDRAIDMVIYGSDYILGLACFYPKAFSLRDRLWKTGRSEFFLLNDVLQALGSFAFRHPIPGYKSAACQFLKLRKVIEHCDIPSGELQRPKEDEAVLAAILDQIDLAISRIVKVL